MKLENNTRIMRRNAKKVIKKEQEGERETYRTEKKQKKM